MAKHILMTPFGKASLVHLNEPDEYEGALKYKTKMSFEPEATALFKAQIEEIASSETFKVKKPKMPWSEDDTYGTQFSFSSQFKPGLFDSKNKPVTETIRGGSTIRIMCEVFNYQKGLSLRVQQVQVKELSAGRGSMFDEVEGFASSSPASSFVDDDGDKDDGFLNALDI